MPFFFAVGCWAESKLSRGGLHIPASGMDPLVKTAPGATDLNQLSSLDYLTAKHRKGL
jgi:hypothetical protein